MLAHTFCLLHDAPFLAPDLPLLAALDRGSTPPELAALLTHLAQSRPLEAPT